MASIIHHILKELIVKNGDALWAAPDEFQLLLDDVFFNRREKELLIKSMQARIPEQLKAAQDPQTRIEHLTLSLAQAESLPVPFAGWAVESWAQALDKLPRAQYVHTDVFLEADQRFRKAIQECLLKGAIDDKDKAMLSQLQTELLLTASDARHILEEVKQDLSPKPAAQPTQAFVGATFENSFGMNFLTVLPHAFQMGSQAHEKGRDPNETQREVQLTKPFAIQMHPITQAQWKAIMKYNPSDFHGDDLPVENVSWNDIVTSFLPKLNAQSEDTYRLPTEAEWECAARAGGLYAYGHNSDLQSLESMAWYQNNANFQTQPVGQKEPNAWGLYDMLGNVLEWCHDWMGAYNPSELSDPQGPPRGDGRVVRGGNWFSDSGSCRCAARGHLPPQTRIRLVGFRLVKEVVS